MAPALLDNCLRGSPACYPGTASRLASLLYGLEEMRPRAASVRLLSQNYDLKLLVLILRALSIPINPFPCTLLFLSIPATSILQVVSKLWDPGDTDSHTRKAPCKNTCNLSLRN